MCEEISPSLGVPKSKKTGVGTWKNSKQTKTRGPAQAMAWEGMTAPQHNPWENTPEKVTSNSGCLKKDGVK